MSPQPKPSSGFQDRHTYIPQHVQQTMDRKMQQSVPAHLKKYVGTDKPAYVPQHVEKALTQHMQKAAPGYMKQYAGAYVQQKVVTPGVASMSAPNTSSAAPTPHAPVPDRLRQDHSGVSASQYEAQFHSLFQPDAPQQSAQPQDYPPADPSPQPQAPTAGGHHQDYEFIINPEQPQARRPMLPGGNSVPVRAAFFAGGLLLLAVLFIVLKSLLSGGSAAPLYVSIAQDQQELIHLSNNAGQQQNLTTATQNFAATAQLSLASSQSELVKYLSKSGTKINSKQLSLKVSSSIDNRLSTASAATTYNQTFKEIMQTKLTDYLGNLKRAYDQSGSKTGKAILSNDYKQAQLLLDLLNSASSNN